MSFGIWTEKTFNSLICAPAAQSPGLGRSQAHSVAQEKKFDLLSDLGGDIFAAPATQSSSSTNFANFAHFPSQSGKLAIAFSQRSQKVQHFTQTLDTQQYRYLAVWSLVCHHPMHCPAIVFISTFIVHFSLCMAAAPQGNSDTNFANFAAFGNTAIPSHLSTSPPSKSFSSGTPLPTIVFPPPYPHTLTLISVFFLFVSYPLCPLGKPFL